jgi:hypothetical protein
LGWGALPRRSFSTSRGFTCSRVRPRPRTGRFLSPPQLKAGRKRRPPAEIRRKSPSPRSPPNRRSPWRRSPNGQPSLLRSRRNPRRPVGNGRQAAAAGHPQRGGSERGPGRDRRDLSSQGCDQTQRQGQAGQGAVRSGGEDARPAGRAVHAAAHRRRAGRRGRRNGDYVAGGRRHGRGL